MVALGHILLNILLDENLTSNYDVIKDVIVTTN